MNNSVTSTSTTNNYNQYTYQMEKLYKLIEDAWYDYIINYNQTVVKLTETSYDNMCKYICEVLKPIIINTTNEMAIQLQQQRERQQKKRYFMYS
jgi:hypothetical protein